MRRKSERVKDKSTERKSEKNSKKSRRSSRRRKKSSSTSPEESDTDDYETSFKSAKDDTEEEHSSSSRSVHGKSRVSLAETNSDTPALATEVEEKEIPPAGGGRTRRHSKKQSADEVEEKQSVTEHESEVKADKVEAETPTDTPEKHKDSENKSSVWQVKSADCSGGEIKKLKLCIVRPPESTEPAPRKRKKLSRMSHKDAEVAESSCEIDEHTSHDSPDEKRKGRKSERNVNEDSNTENYKLVGSPEKKTIDVDSSGDEQRKEASVGRKVSVDEGKDKEDQESSLDESTTDEPPLECKEKTIDPFDELTKETRAPEKEKVVEQSNSPITKSILVDSSISPNSTPKLATSEVLFESLKVKTTETRPSEKKFDENFADPAESKVQKNTTMFPPKDASMSPKETNANAVAKVKPTAEKEPESCEAIKEKMRDQNHEDTSIALDCREEKAKVCNSDFDLSKAPQKDVSMPETISKSRNSSVDKNDKSSTRKSAENTKNPACSEYDSSICKLSAKALKSHGSSPEKSKSRHSSEGSSKDGDSEAERLNHRKQHTDKKRSIQLNRASSDSRHRTREKDELNSSISAPLKDSKVRSESTEESHDQQSGSKSTNKSKSESKDSKTKSFSEETSRAERRKYKTFSTQGSAESITEKPQVREKISLKRSASYAIYPLSSLCIPGGVEVKEENEGKPHDEHPDQSSTKDEKVSAVTEAVPNLTRKRRWRASQTISTAGKKPTLSISSDSLKHLIPEAKPLAISEVQLTEDEDEEEEEGEVVSEKVREPIEKDDDTDVNKSKDEVLSSKLTEEQKLYPSPMVPDPPDSNAGPVRKISLMSSDAARLQRSPSPARHKVSNVLFVTNLVRPFTVNQLKELLARTGHILNDGFWIDKIKSKCYVQYETNTEAEETRHALHGVRWPVSNPKQLCVDFAKKEDMDLAQELSEGNHIPRKTEPLKIERIDNWVTDQGRDKEREHAMKEEREREKLRAKEKIALGPMDILEKSRAAKMAMSVREWDLGKMDLGQFDDRGFHREERSRERERERRIRKERNLRSSSPRDLPVRKMRKKEEDAPAKLLDDLFKKTKVTPCVYWLPLTADQIVVKEEMRRKHMAEHERRMAEMRKAERDRQRVRIQGRSSQRRFDDRDREKRKHRSLSGSPKK